MMRPRSMALREAEAKILTILPASQQNSSRLIGFETQANIFQATISAT